jgi:murein L,D-transpeptidase YcbB/YkuD
MIFSIKYPAGVKIINFKRIWAPILASLSCMGVFAQLTPGVLQSYLSENLKDKKSGIIYTENVQEFYALNHYQTAWIQQKDTTSLVRLLNHLSSAANWGLREQDYQYHFIAVYKNGTSVPGSQEDSLKADVLFTDAAIHFFRDVAYGNAVPALNYSGIKYIPGCVNVATILWDFVSENRASLLASLDATKIPEIKIIENKINWILEVMNQNDFEEIHIHSKKIRTENKSLWHKLHQLGILDSANIDFSESGMKQKIKEAQRLFNLSENDELNQELIRELNVPLKVRLQQLNFSINYYRWLSCFAQNQAVIVVNIPAAYLKVYQGNQAILEMRMVVGKSSTPTFTLASVVNEVILYPYWHVPLSIATKELLPAIKRNPGYLDANNYQVLNKEGKVVNPYSINWHALSRNYFPYIIRQSTGCDNSLGLLKLNFYNPFGAYLHDTPAKDLFKQRRRFYSHGCMRMEKPMELGHLILKNNQVAIDTLTEKGCLKNQSPVTVAADVKMPVIVWYNPAGVDSSGRILFFEDVYKKFNWVK